MVKVPTRRQKKEIEGRGRSHGQHQRVAQAPVRRDQQYGDKKHQRNSRVIDMQAEVDGCDRCDGRDYDHIAHCLYLNSGFHIRIVRWG